MSESSMPGTVWKAGKRAVAAGLPLARQAGNSWSRRRFAMLEQMDPGDTAALGAVWSRLAVFLEVHAAAEEQLFYPELLAAGLAGGAAGTQTAEAETLDAIHDHNDIRDAVRAVAGHEVGSAGWYAAVAAANLANSDHMAEEEREGLTYFRRHASLQIKDKHGGVV